MKTVVFRQSRARAGGGGGGAIRALYNAAADLRIILQLELEADEKLAATADSKREKAIAASKASLNYASSNQPTRLPQTFAKPAPPRVTLNRS
jgi:hypothetical protein